MAYWLVKSEPSVYSWEQFVKDKKTTWDGIRNYAARLHLMAMRKNDKVFFYHSNEGMEIVGIAEVFKESFPESPEAETKWVAVGLKAVKKLKRPVTLAEMKKEKKLANMALIRISRLSVSPVSEEEWGIIMHMTGEK
jgi:predicted RNA-binding protein with PUA-like domain